MTNTTRKGLSLADILSITGMHSASDLHSQHVHSQSLNSAATSLTQHGEFEAGVPQIPNGVVRGSGKGKGETCIHTVVTLLIMAATQQSTNTS